MPFSGFSWKGCGVNSRKFWKSVMSPRATWVRTGDDEQLLRILSGVCGGDGGSG